jgi:hypothetical protein
VTLLVGDDVTLDANSEILADEGIVIRGDHGNLDAGFGTNMTCAAASSRRATSPGQPDRRAVGGFGHPDVHDQHSSRRSSATRMWTAPIR